MPVRFAIPACLHNKNTQVQISRKSDIHRNWIQSRLRRDGFPRSAGQAGFTVACGGVVYFAILCYFTVNVTSWLVTLPELFFTVTL